MCIRDRHGHEEGDRYILTAVREIRSVCRNSDSLFRYGGDELLLLLAGMRAEEAEKKAEAINDRLRNLAEESGFPYPLSFSYGIVESTEISDCELLIREADQKMYAQKRKKRMARE